MYPFRKCREIAGLSQKEAAISLKVKAPSMVEWEKGKSNPTIENLIKMAQLYQMSVDTLLGLDELPVITAGDSKKASPAEERLLAAARELNAKGVEELIHHAGVLAGNAYYTEERAVVSAG